MDKEIELNIESEYISAKPSFYDLEYKILPDGSYEITRKPKTMKKYTEFTYFWNEAPFSQWSHSKFTVNKITYNTAEQYMMAQKALFFGDKDTFKKIMEAKSPREQKALGRTVKGFDKGRWDANARSIVFTGNYYKFTQNPDMLEVLRKTAGTMLVEASPYDTIWGIGIDAKDAKNGKPWKGTNWLGEVLTVLRDDYFAEDIVRTLPV